MHVVYVIFSPSLDRYYVGEAEDLGMRLSQHNDHHYKGSFTVRASDWEVRTSLSCRDRSHARLVEAYIKRQRKRSFIERLIAEAGLREWLLAHCEKPQ